MRAIDLHVHPFTREILAKTPEWFWRRPRKVFGIERREISLDGLLRDMDEAGVERAVLLAFDCETTYGFKVANEVPLPDEVREKILYRNAAAILSRAGAAI